MKSIFFKLSSKKSTILPLFFSFIYFLLVFILIHKTPITGTANQFDFERMFNWIGVSYKGNDGEITRFNWVNRYFNLGENKPTDTFSSSLIFLYFAKFVNNLIHPGLFDIRILGIIYSFFFSLLLFFLFYQLKKINFRYFILAAPFLIFSLSDVSYIAYFNSGFQEPTGLIFLYLFLGILLYSLSNKNKFKTNFLLLNLSSVFLIIAKAQYVPLVISIIFCNILVFWEKIPKKHLFLNSLSLVVISLSFLFFGIAPVMKRWNAYNTVFSQALGYAENQSEAIKIIGIDQEFLKYAGSSAHEINSGVDDPLLEKDLNVITITKTFIFYLKHPKQTFHQVKRVSEHSFSSIIYHVGYYEMDSGEPAGQLPYKGIHWEKIKQNYLLKFSDFLPFFLLFSTLFFLRSYFKNKEKLLIIGVFISLSATIQFFLIVFTEGMVDTEKHLFLYSILFDLLIIYCFISFIEFLNKLLRRKPNKKI